MITGGKPTPDRFQSTIIRGALLLNCPPSGGQRSDLQLATVRSLRKVTLADGRVGRRVDRIVDRAIGQPVQSGRPGPSVELQVMAIFGRVADDHSARICPL